MRVSQLFIDHNIKFLEIYREYFCNLNDSVELIKQLAHEKKPNDPQFKLLLEQFESKLFNSKSFRLNHLLVCPFQRITKYHIFLKELFFNTEKNKLETKQQIESAWKTMENLCQFLNQAKRDQDSLDKINSLYKSLNGGIAGLDLKSYGRFIKDETIVQLSGPQIKDTSKVVLFLFEKSLIITKKTTNGKYSYIDSLSIDANLLCYNNKSMSANNSKVCFSLNNLMLNKQYYFNFKSAKLKDFWFELISIVRATQTSKVRSHQFTFTNFDKNLIECSVCHTLLNGIFFQGFKCDLCSLVFHKECLDSAKKCQLDFDSSNINKENGALNREGTQRIPDKNISVNRASSQIEIYKSVKKSELNDSKLPILKFDPNEYVFVIETKNHVCKGYKLRFKSNKLHIYKEEGYFLDSCVSRIDKLAELNMYSWFLEGDKQLALKILTNLACNDASLFMVRYDKVKYVLTIKLSSKQLKHIQIETNSTDSFELAESGSYFVRVNKTGSSSNDGFYTLDRKRYFKTIVELVNFFMVNKLSDYFDDLNILEVPFREALSEPIFTTIATYDYESKLGLVIILLLLD